MTLSTPHVCALEGSYVIFVQLNLISHSESMFPSDFGGDLSIENRRLLQVSAREFHLRAISQLQFCSSACAGCKTVIHICDLLQT